MTDPSSPTPIRLGVAILAAGASSRMGQPKLLLRWGTVSVLEHLLSLWHSLGADQIAVIHSALSPAVRVALDRIQFPEQNRILNPSPDRGMFSSVQCAANWSGWQESLSHIAFVLGDQPHVTTATLRQVIEVAAAHPKAIHQPSRNARARHPVFVPRDVLPALANSVEPDLKHFLRKWRGPFALVETGDPALDLDLDTPADYEKALQMFTPGPSE